MALEGVTAGEFDSEGLGFPGEPRAGALFAEMSDDASTLSRRLTVVKVAKPNQDLRFDVPVVGVPTIEIMLAAGATCLCVEAGRTLLFDREAMIATAAAAGIAIFGASVTKE